MVGSCPGSKVLGFYGEWGLLIFLSRLVWTWLE